MHARAFAAPWLYLLLAGMHLLHGNGWSGQETSPDLTSIDAYVAARMRSARIPGVALAIVQGERIVYLRGYGRADQSGRPVTPETPFIIGSITKSMTALAVMQLVEDGLVELDAPVQRYIPWFRLADPAASAQITVRMLIDQTSGIPQGPTFVTWNDSTNEKPPITTTPKFRCDGVTDILPVGIEGSSPGSSGSSSEGCVSGGTGVGTHPVPHS